MSNTFQKYNCMKNLRVTINSDFADQNLGRDFLDYHHLDKRSNSQVSNIALYLVLVFTNKIFDRKVVLQLSVGNNLLAEKLIIRCMWYYFGSGGLRNAFFLRHFFRI